ncbi:outer membrane protein transport protein [Chromobacterium phragmitis]|uniref:OmpP1/FadL family transporter n=2 Tax=Chromobacterium amazonense TaxID=1382803 RepID=UPI0021B7A96D|nr:outer membrane protein transport protein [Chromobacterium amazonense]MBM2884502.1 outer membrane protein transport protein [Chromobacterium amazonense]
MRTAHRHPPNPLFSEHHADFKMKRLLLLASLAGALPVSQCAAAGLYLYELGTEDVGLANAGAAARAQDPGTIATNPAGMTELSGSQLSVNGQALYGDIAYTLDQDRPRSGGNPGNVLGWYPGGSVFYSQQMDEQLTLGFGMYGNFGLGLDFGDWAARSLIRESTLLGVTLQPSAAYKLDERWSIGGGIGINYGVFSFERDAWRGTVRQVDRDWALSGKFGVLYKPDGRTRIGLSYSSETRFRYQADATVGNFPLPISAQVNAPRQLMLSGFRQLSPQLAILGSAGWQNWSRFGDSELEIASASVSGASRLRDSWHASLGAQYQLKPKLRVNAGLAFDSSFYRDQNNTALTMPSGKSWRFGLGGQYQATATSSIGLSLEYLTSDNARVSNPLYKGSYRHPQLYFLGLQYTQRL